MPNTILYDKTGASIGNVELSEELFGAPINVAVLHQVDERVPVDGLKFGVRVLDRFLSNS